MQDKETVDDSEEALTVKSNVVNDRQTTGTVGDRKEVTKEPTKEGKFQFRKMKTPKKEKPDKNSPSKYEGDGVVFKAKLIGLESIPDARGDKMCQDAMQRLKLAVKNSGQHKRKITISVSFQGIKVKDEKTAVTLYHHPVSLISFISQDIMDARAFGYVFGSTSEPHQFIAIKTEKPAFHVVLALRDLFQTVLNCKQEQIENVKEQTNDGVKQEKNDLLKTQNNNIIEKIISPSNAEESKLKDENIYFEVLLTEPVNVPEEDFPLKEDPVKTVDDLIGLQTEMTKLQEGIYQMDTSIAAAAAYNTEIPIPDNDPFDTSFVLGPKRGSIPFPMPTPIPVPASAPSYPTDNLTLMDSGDKYAAFNTIDSSPSVFESAESAEKEAAVTDIRELEEEITRKMVAPAKPPRTSKSASPDLSVFADLDPLGKDRPYKDKTEFFQDLKNPPKKVLNDLVDSSKDANRSFDAGPMSPPVPFPVDFMSPPTSVASPHGRALSKQDLTATYNYNTNTQYDSHTTNNNYAILVGVNGRISNGSPHPAANELNNFHPHNAMSSPIPIPQAKDRSFSNGNIGSPYSKSPQTFGAESPSNSDYYVCNYNYTEGGGSPTGTRLGHCTNGDINGHNNNNLTKQNVNSFLNSSAANTHNGGVCRPRPRPALNKGGGGSVPNGGRTVSSHSLSSDSSSDYEAISRESMQSIANLLTNGHRLRAQSLCLETNSDFKLKLPGDKNIFAKKNDPFADDFFFSVPKKNGHMTSAEISECV